MRKKKKNKDGIIIFISLIIIIIVGGIFIMSNNNEKKQHDKIADIKTNNTKENSDTKDNNKDEIKTNKNLEKAPTTYEEFQELKDGEYVTEKGYTLKITNGATYIDNQIIVNKTYKLSENYIPENTKEKITTDKCNNCIIDEAYDKFKEMQADASTLGLNIYISSGYRSYNYQQKLYNNYSAVNGDEEADRYSAKPGHSEHQTGTCFDLNTIDSSFANTDEGKYVDSNAYRYGFIIRFPEGKEDKTGYLYEPWHLRYVGEELAKKLYNNGNWITMEEYYGITSKYR